MKTKRKGPSLYPQQVTPGVWYYEDKRSIEVIIDLNEFTHGEHTGTHLRFDIPKRKLKKSLERMK